MKLGIIKVDPVPEHYDVYVPFLEYKKAFTIGWGAVLSDEVMLFANTLSFYKTLSYIGDGDEDDYLCISFLTKEDAEKFSQFVTSYRT